MSDIILLGDRQGYIPRLRLCLTLETKLDLSAETANFFAEAEPAEVVVVVVDDNVARSREDRVDGPRRRMNLIDILERSERLRHKLFDPLVGGSTNVMVKLHLGLADLDLSRLRLGVSFGNTPGRLGLTILSALRFSKYAVYWVLQI
jgi:hypothetical protein